VAETTHIMVLWLITPCSLVGEGMYCHHVQWIIGVVNVLFIRTEERKEIGLAFFLYYCLFCLFFAPSAC
jgi:hypothetical protein